MSGLQNIDLDLDIFYKKDNLPKISVGDKIKVVIYLELPKEIGDKEKKKKKELKHLKELLFRNTYQIKKLILR